MRFASILTVLTAAITMSAATNPTTTPDGLVIETIKAVQSDRRTVNGDQVKVHYRGTLQSNGQKFDASYDRGEPLGFILGSGMVIKGWEQGLLGMAIGEKRKLTIPPNLAYGDRGIGPIPGGATLIFETELVEISKGEL
ncbi:TPA_exp: Peptidyl-prolyl cis-trans isomerase [Trichophyton benhamiae CBS 112371]|uniref:peptidylprolyl isomerase n=1 Tax=Arthroderma benhamiae (strain ATCC MYA-4681 / CBS 112371) TaxID=663331 RepID=D4APQ9_ARTBC|nr:FKBP-type peptidyl-prolyl isomerase, putative [Trichophyton benhamiae CBS 112371]EFE35270.1 FKBP-type peptidyl-prolyl isomerase, putative [Trichophyton benhamiae CBS 112371]DAA78149.1 TPA_exp: Peptidyl-prolyl cis-trans isomerase [Trichophyton benhamiae CBS 112371]